MHVCTYASTFFLFLFLFLSLFLTNTQCGTIIVNAHCRLTFRAGQWIDLFIPGVDTVGGFSIANPPSLRPGQVIPAPIEVRRAADALVQSGQTPWGSSGQPASIEPVSRMLVQLAVKSARHPPAEWMHSACRVDSKVALRVGGSVVLRQSEPSRPALFIGGGIGIAPLHSMIAERSLNSGVLEANLVPITVFAYIHEHTCTCTSAHAHEFSYTGAS